MKEINASLSREIGSKKIMVGFVISTSRDLIATVMLQLVTNQNNCIMTLYNKYLS